MINNSKVYDSKKFGEFIIIDSLPDGYFLIKFNKTGFVTKCSMRSIKNGTVKDLTHPSFYGVGFIGFGDFKPTFNGKSTSAYNIWVGMIKRCYSLGSQKYHRYGGRGVYVCDDWLNFQNFANWYNSHEKSNIKGFNLDKDLTIIGSKCYSPESCDLIPIRVNSMMTMSNRSRGDLPVGVSRLDGSYISCCSDGNGNQIYLGHFNSQDKAFCTYKHFKENVIKNVANEEYLAGNISHEIYKNLCSWNITRFPE